MANISQKKRKLLLLARIFWEETDEQHSLSLTQLLERLEELGCPAERKSLYDDMETLRSVGYPVRGEKLPGSTAYGYRLSRRLFSPEELARLSQASPELAEKLSRLGSRYQTQSLSGGGEAPPSGGEKEAKGEKVTLELSPEKREELLRRLPGEPPDFEPAGKNRLRVSFRAELNRDWMDWLFLSAPQVRLLAPKKQAEALRERAKAAAKCYKGI